MVSTPPSQYLLRWNDHLSTYGDILFSLREQEEYVDCSIACEDGLVGAHRVVLAGCSSYLRDLFSRVPNPHPVIFLLNTPRSLVLMLMEFIYRGQVHIPQHRLQQLVMLGQALKIKGLTQIMVPVSSTSSRSSESSSSITPLAFPQGLPLTTTNTLPFTAIPTCNTTMDISVLSCENGQQASEEERFEDSRTDGEEDEAEDGTEEERKRSESFNVKRRKTTGRPRGRPCRQGTPPRGSIRPKKPESSPLKSYLTTTSDRVTIGAYAVCHGIDAAQSYVLEKYHINARQKTLQRLIVWYKDYQKAKERRAKRKRKQAQKK